MLISSQQEAHPQGTRTQLALILNLSETKKNVHGCVCKGAGRSVQVHANTCDG